MFSYVVLQGEPLYVVLNCRLCAACKPQYIVHQHFLSESSLCAALHLANGCWQFPNCHRGTEEAFVLPNLKVKEDAYIQKIYAQWNARRLKLWEMRRLVWYFQICICNKQKQCFGGQTINAVHLSYGHSSSTLQSLLIKSNSLWSKCQSWTHCCGGILFRHLTDLSALVIKPVLLLFPNIGLTRKRLKLCHVM